MAMATALMVVALVAVIAGFSPATGRSPLAAELHRLRQIYIDAQWSLVASTYPEALRPSVGVTRVVSGWDWLRSRVRCLRAAGFAAEVTAGGSSYTVSSTVGQTPLEAAITNYSCAASFASIGALSQYLSRQHLAALRSYDLGFVRPCLLFAGQPSPLPSGQATLVAGDSLGRRWNPFEQVWLGGLSDSAITYFEARCPPVPPWFAVAR
ncbi:MAG TPA: hypothetical protein DCP11_04490 [Microbacteriaceae bacterium]|nr:hypothetical protein [Microbacteriaceae bacterium]